MVKLFAYVKVIKKDKEFMDNISAKEFNDKFKMITTAEEKKKMVDTFNLSTDDACSLFYEISSYHLKNIEKYGDGLYAVYKWNALLLDIFDHLKTKSSFEQFLDVIQEMKVWTGKERIDEVVSMLNITEKEAEKNK